LVALGATGSIEIVSPVEGMTCAPPCVDRIDRIRRTARVVVEAPVNLAIEKACPMSTDVQMAW
jgi:hypothetical protein